MSENATTYNVGECLKIKAQRDVAMGGDITTTTTIKINLKELSNLTLQNNIDVQHEIGAVLMAIDRQDVDGWKVLDELGQKSGPDFWKWLFQALLK